VTLASVLVDAGALFDSLSQSFIRTIAAEGHQFQNAASIKQFQKKLDGEVNFTAGDYRELLETEFNLSQKIVNLNVHGGDVCSHPLRCLSDIQNRFPICPFEEWSKGKAPVWWDCFTKLKHDRTKHMEVAALGMLLHAVAGNFVLLTVFHDEYLKSKIHNIEFLELYTPLYWRVRASSTIMRPIFA
jgi:hypothetical protein